MWQQPRPDTTSRGQPGRRQCVVGCMRLKSLMSTVLLAGCLAGCGGGGGTAEPVDPPPPVADPDPFADVDRTASAAFTAQGISGMGVAIYDAQGVKRFEKMYGNFAAD